MLIVNSSFCDHTSCSFNISTCLAIDRGVYQAIVLSYKDSLRTRVHKLILVLTFILASKYNGFCILYFARAAMDLTKGP